MKDKALVKLLLKLQEKGAPISSDFIAFVAEVETDKPEDAEEKSKNTPIH